jgi:multisubunit Na+/H+ antiporter MnhC subunit
MHGYSALEQIKSPWFVLITLFTVVQMTRINYFVATIRAQERYLLGSEKRAKIVNDFFDVALPLGGVLSIPFIGTLLDKTSTPFALGSLVVTATIIGVLGCLPYMWAAIANVCLFVVYRPFYYTTVSDYSAKVFGFQTFGKVYGLIICLAGLFNFLQSPLDAMTHKVFNANPIPVNVVLLGLAVVVGAALVSFTFIKSRNMKRDHLEEEAEDAEETLMPDTNGQNYGT